MRYELLERLKKDIATTLAAHLREEGITLLCAANDNSAGTSVTLETIDSAPLPATKLLTEIRVILHVLAKPWQCNTIIEGIYQHLCHCPLSVQELTVLLMSLHAETPRRIRSRKSSRRATIRYVVEEEQA